MDAAVEGGRSVVHIDATEYKQEDTEMERPSVDTDNAELDDGDNAKDGEAEVTNESASFRIVVQNLPRYFGFKQLKKWFSKLGLDPAKVKPTQGKGRHGAVVACYLTFRKKEEVDDAIRKISTTPFSGSSLTAKIADAAPEPNYRGRQQDQKRTLQPSTKPPEEEILDIVTNLHHLNYEDQLKSKQNHAKEILRKIDKKFNHNAQGTLPWLKKSKGHLCQLDPIKPSPEPQKYRNKCEFSIGVAPNRDRTIGFKLGKYKEGIFWVIDPDACLHINDRMKELVKVFQDFIRSSTLEPFDDPTRKGHYHMLTVRTNKAGHSMINIHLHPQGLSPEKFVEEKQRLRSHCEALPVESRPTFVYWVLDDKTMSGPRRSMRTEEELVFGEKGASFGEELMGYQFKISPDAFFQVNTSAAEVLYSTLIEAASLRPKTIVLDLCCGTGTIGILMAKHAKKVYGIELGEAAVADAVENAKINGVENIEFICAKVEDALDSVLAKLEPDDDVAVILDPPRNGVHNNVVDTLRKQSRINRLLYVACAADNDFTISNLYGLCRNRARFERGGETPFVPVRCTPVDLFPQTKNVELIFVFDRVSKETLVAQ
ncbi:hypothetical protein RvY_15934 [Ramazzottius varieornatus]|uniref:tRNA (uracil(54)-C(5))-methyltransferase n=1 Tax=Ramazzottius varieornatus TaxID=947166 RepID=A0A1D1VWN5_RAMVA|nr:hypothetical protein RvY_15934 [Ramazzottius varieornatus]